MEFMVIFKRLVVTIYMNNTCFVNILGLIIAIFGNSLLMFFAVEGSLGMSFFTFLLICSGLFCVFGANNSELNFLSYPAFFTVLTVISVFLNIVFPEKIGLIYTIVSALASVLFQFYAAFKKKKVETQN